MLPRACPLTLSYSHTAPWWLRSVLSQGKIRECGKAWETTVECAFLCTLLSWPEDNYRGHSLSPQQGGPLCTGHSWEYKSKLSFSDLIHTSVSPWESSLWRAYMVLVWYVIILQTYSMWRVGVQPNIQLAFTNWQSWDNCKHMRHYIISLHELFCWLQRGGLVAQWLVVLPLSKKVWAGIRLEVVLGVVCIFSCVCVGSLPQSKKHAHSVDWRL